jgi:hypothetical protein
MSPDIIKKFLDVQGEQIKNDQAEIKLKERELDSNMRHAKNVLDAQVKDNEGQRAHDLKTQRNSLIIIVLVLLFLGVFLYLSFSYEKTNLIEDFFKVTIPALVTLFGGYQWGKNKQKKETQDSN